MAQIAYWIAHATSGWTGTPTGAQIAAGNQSDNSAATFSGSESAPGSGSGTITETTATTGASASTAYTIAWVVYDDVALTYSNVVTGEITTSAAALDVSTTPASAAASGAGASVSLARVVNAAPASASASGVSASVSFGLSVSASPATAAAAGLPAGVSLALEINASPASGVASGASASITAGSGISATPGVASASGVSASVSLGLNVAASPAAALAAGLSALVDLGGIGAGPAVAAASGASAAVSLGLSITAVPASATASGPGALLVSLLEGDTESVYYFPVRYFASASSGAVTATSDLENLRSLLPSQRQQVINPDGTMAAPWYRFFDYFVNVFAGGPSAPTMADVQAAIEQALSELQAQQQTVALVASQSQTNAEALAATVEVVRTSSLPGSTSIPSVSLSYLEP